MTYLNPAQSGLIDLARSKHKEYVEASPFPNIYFDDFFNEEVIDDVLNEFPDLTGKTDISYNDSNQVKLATKGEYRFGEHTKAFAHFLNSQPFLEFLSCLTGIDALVPDPYFVGGGCHQILPGGLLKIHADFNKNQITQLDRRLNVLIYLNKDWEETWGGHFELWDRDMEKCVKKILPLFNRMAIFTTTDFSYHGHPDPLRCPEDRSRKSFALYYYTNGRPESELNPGLENHSTLFQTRKGLDQQRVVSKKTVAKSILKQITPPIILKGLGKLVH
jgi:Rps23 Pro-64 3,4-dihydroxylase Tpa1-like proline 4-hydroxylase